MSQFRRRQQTGTSEEEEESSSSSSSSRSDLLDSSEEEEEEDVTEPIEPEPITETIRIDEEEEEEEQEVEEIEVEPEKEAKKSKKKTPTKAPKKENTPRKQKQRKGPAKVTDIVHCIDVVTFMDASGLDLACLLMATKAPKTLKIYCVRMDETTRLMTSPFYEHKLSLEAETDTVSVPSATYLDCFNGAKLYNLAIWHHASCRLGADPQKLNYVPTMNQRISLILRETFFFYDVTGAIKDTTDDGYNGINNKEDDDDMPLSDDESSRASVPQADEEAKKREKSRIIMMLLRDSPRGQSHVPMTTNEMMMEPNAPVVLSNEPLHIRWYDPRGETRKLLSWLHKFVALKERAETEKWCLKDHNLYWATIDSKPERAISVTDQFYSAMRPRTSYTDTGAIVHLTTEYMRQFIYTWKPFTYISILIAANIDTMPNLFYIHSHLDQYKRKEGDGPMMQFEKFSHHEMNDVAQLIRHMDSLFMLNLPTITVNTVATPVTTAIATTIPETKYYDYRKLMSNVTGHIQHMMYAFGIKYDVSDAMLYRMIKAAVLQHIVLPYIVSEIDNKAKTEAHFNRSTCSIVTLGRISEIYTKFTGALLEREESPEYQKSVQLIVNVIRERENVQFKGDTTYVDPTVHYDEHRYSLGFHQADLCQIMNLIYRKDTNIPSVIDREQSKQPWIPVFDSIDKVRNDDSSDWIDINRIVLFRISTTDRDTTLYEESIHSLLVNHFVDETQVFDEIDALLVPRVTTQSITSKRVNITLSYTRDILEWKDAKLIRHVIQDKPSNTIVIVSNNSGYTRGMLPRFFVTQKMPNFYSQYCVTVDQLVKDGVSIKEKRKKTHVVIPYLHLMSPKELYQILRWLTNDGTGPIHATRVFITGCIDILAATPGQVFVDFLRCVNYSRYNQMLWRFDRPAEIFSSLMHHHWRVVELIEKNAHSVTRFMQSFHRMTSTVCHGIKDVWYAKDFPTLAFYIACLQNKVNQRGSVAANRQPVQPMPEYSYTPFKSLTLNFYNRRNKNNKPIQIFRDSMRIETRSSGTMSDTSLVYSDFTTPMDTLQLDRNLVGYSLNYDEVRHINRHVLIVTMSDLSTMSRNELNTLFCMTNNLFLIDNPYAPVPTQSTRNTQPSPPSLFSQHQEWHCASPSSCQDKIASYFGSKDKYATCRNTYETYVSKINTSPMRSPTIASMEDVLTALPDLSIKRKRDDNEDDNDEEEEEEREMEIEEKKQKTKPTKSKKARYQKRSNL